MEKVKLCSFIVAGTKFRKLTNYQIETLTKGAVIQLEREPTNEYDTNAIICNAYIDGKPTHVGYVPKEIAKFLSPMIDDSLVFEAVVLDARGQVIRAGLLWNKEAKKDAS
jgi:hypothetical protein